MKKILYFMLIGKLLTSSLEATTVEDDQHNDYYPQLVAQYIDDTPDLLETRGAPITQVRHNHKMLKADQVKEYATNFTQDYLAQKNVQYGSLPKSIQKRVVAISDAVSKALVAQLIQRGQSSIDSINVDRMLQDALATIIQSSSADLFVHMPDILNITNKFINSAFTEAQLSTDAIPSVMAQEFIERKNAIHTLLNSSMEARKQDFVTTQEIALAVKNVFEGFILRMQHVLTWNWVSGEIDAIKREPKIADQTPSSRFPTNKKRQEMLRDLSFLNLPERDYRSYLSHNRTKKFAPAK